MTVNMYCVDAGHSFGSNSIPIFIQLPFRVMIDIIRYGVSFLIRKTVLINGKKGWTG